MYAKITKCMEFLVYIFSSYAEYACAA